MKKHDFKIVKKGVLYHIFMKKKFLFFFDRWVEVTWTDNHVEVPITFKSYKEAIAFINSFAD